MRTNRMLMAATALALGASLGAWAEEGERPDVVRGERVFVQASNVRGGYVTEKDSVLLGEVMRALDADRYTNNALLSVIAKNGELMVIGTTTDTAQSTRVVMKLKSMPGVTRVYAFLDTMGGGDSN